MDIIKDPEFKEANSVFYAEIAQLKREGKAKTEHKPPINNDDMKKLYESGLFSQKPTRHIAKQSFLRHYVTFLQERAPKSQGIEEN